MQTLKIQGLETTSAESALPKHLIHFKGFPTVMIGTLILTTGDQAAVTLLSSCHRRILVPDRRDSNIDAGFWVCGGCHRLAYTSSPTVALQRNSEGEWALQRPTRFTGWFERTADPLSSALSAALTEEIVESLVNLLLRTARVHEKERFASINQSLNSVWEKLSAAVEDTNGEPTAFLESLGAPYSLSPVAQP